MALPILLRIIVWIRACLNFVISPFRSGSDKCHPVDKIDPESKDEKHDNSLLLLSATLLSKMIRNGTVSSQKAVATYIRRARQVNGQLNAMVLDTFDSALEQARQVDEKLANGSAPSVQQCPLYGVPLTCKECFEAEGFPNTAGLVHRRNLTAESDAPVLQRLRSAGAILIGLSNVSELCLWFECHNRLYGTTTNPYDSRCTPGGSSGGEAALVGAGASVIGIGSDVGGSIRMPAFFCGVFGHRPSAGLVPNDGQYPLATNARSRKMLSTGPICRYAEDLELILKIMATGTDDVQRFKDIGLSVESQAYLPASEGSASLVTSTDDIDDSNASVGIRLQRAAAMVLGDSELVCSHSDWPLMHAAAVAGLCNSALPPVDLSSLRYTSIVDEYTATSVLQSPLDEELREMQMRVETVLSQRHGVTVEPRTLSKMRCASATWTIGMSDLGGPDMTERLFSIPSEQAGVWPCVKELAKWCFGKSDHTFICLMTAILGRQFKGLPAAKQTKLRQIRRALEHEIEELIGENGVLLFPSHPTLAPRHHYPILTPLNYAHTAVFNLCGMPVTQCPLGLSQDGLPLGVQVVSLQGNDRITLAVARDLQEAFGGWTPPGYRSR